MARNIDPARRLEAQKLSQKLKAHLDDKGWNQSQLARRATQVSGIRVGRDAISKYVRAENLPERPHLVAIAKALGVEPDELVGPNVQPWRSTAGPKFEVRSLPDGEVWVHIEQKMGREKARLIADILLASERDAPPQT